MSRLPFDPGKLPQRDVGTPARRERARGGDASTALTVTQLTLLIKDVLATRTPQPLQVVGEVSNFRDRKHWYLTLKDAENVIDCVMFASAASKVRFDVEPGQQVVATGRLDFYGPQGRIQLYVDKLEPVGIGALELQFRQLCEELRAAGYFADERKKPLPAFPQHIAVVTSGSGAALHDVVRTARQRWPGIALTLVDVLVQGADAAPQVAGAIDALSNRYGELGIDAVILTRGGGSLEDLWAFNERVVADALLRCEVPVVAAIGHETDTTIAELVADLRCSTPTQAAAVLVPDRTAEHQHVAQLAQRLRLGLQRHAQHQRARLDAVARHEWFRKPEEFIARRKTELAELQRRVQADITQHVAERRKYTDALARQLTAVGPANVLQRGYSYTTDAQGTILRKAGQVAPGQLIHTHLAAGQLASRVVDDKGDAPTPPARPPRRRTRKPAGEDQTGGLFG